MKSKFPNSQKKHNQVNMCCPRNADYVLHDANTETVFLGFPFPLYFVRMLEAVDLQTARVNSLISRTFEVHADSSQLQERGLEPSQQTFCSGLGKFEEMASVPSPLCRPD